MTGTVIRAANCEAPDDAEREREAPTGRLGVDPRATTDDAATAGGLRLAELSALDPHELALLATLGC